MHYNAIKEKTYCNDSEQRVGTSRDTELAIKSHALLEQLFNSILITISPFMSIKYVPTFGKVCISMIVNFSTMITNSLY